MALPRQVQAIEERTQQLIAERDAQATPEKPEPTQPQEPERPEPVAEAEPAKPEPERVDWKGKFHVLQGKYNAEVPRLHAENKALQARVDAAEAATAELRKQLDTAPKATEPALDQAMEALRKEYGDVVVTAIERATAQRVEAAVKPLQAEVAQTKAERDEQRQKEARSQQAAAFSDAVNDLVPEWEAIDTMPAFHDYLAENGTDGRSRQEALIDAANRYDAAGAARIFAGFKRSAAYTEAQRVKTAQATSKDALAAKLTPDPAGRAPQPPAGKTFTSQEIKDFYRDKALGRIPADRAKEIERELEAAIRDGRVK